MGMFNDLHKQDLADKAKQTQEQQVSKQVFFQENKQTSLQANKQALKQGSAENKQQTPSVESPHFRIDNDPYTQATFRFTDDELDALEDLKRDLKRQRDLKTTKQNLIRYALHRLIEEYNEEGEESWLVKQLRSK